MGRVIELQRRAPKAALENLNRMTGLDFHAWPESLLEKSAPATASATLRGARADIVRAIRSWK